MTRDSLGAATGLLSSSVRSSSSSISSSSPPTAQALGSALGATAEAAAGFFLRLKEALDPNSQLGFVA